MCITHPYPSQEGNVENQNKFLRFLLKKRLHAVCNLLKIILGDEGLLFSWCPFIFGT